MLEGLVKVTNENGKLTVSARELYFALELDKSHWKRWYEKNIINNAYFIEVRDWKGFVCQVNGNETVDFTISLEMAKHIINSAKTAKTNVKINILKNLGIYDEIDTTSRSEIRFLEKLEDALKPFAIQGIKQYHILDYYIDYYIPSLNISVEYDENKHRHYTYEQHEGRQKKIEKELGCKFIRVSDENNDAYNIGFIIKNIFFNVGDINEKYTSKTF